MAPPPVTIPASIILLVHFTKEKILAQVSHGFAGGCGVFVTTFVLHHASERKPAYEKPLPVLAAYLKASYTRDYPDAYRYISSRDRRVWDAKSYARQYRTFTGFAFELAQELSAASKKGTHHLDRGVVDSSAARPTVSLPRKLFVLLPAAFLLHRQGCHPHTLTFSRGR